MAERAAAPDYWLPLRHCILEDDSSVVLNLFEEVVLRVTAEGIVDQGKRIKGTAYEGKSTGWPPGGQTRSWTDGPRRCAPF